MSGAGPRRPRRPRRAAPRPARAAPSRAGRCRRRRRRSRPGLERPARLGLLVRRGLRRRCCRRRPPRWGTASATASGLGAARLHGRGARGRGGRGARSGGRCGGRCGRGGGRGCGSRLLGGRGRRRGRRVHRRVRGGPYVAGGAVPDQRDGAAGRDRQRARSQGRIGPLAGLPVGPPQPPVGVSGWRVHARVVGGQTVDLADEAGEALDVGERVPRVLEEAVGRAPAAVGHAGLAAAGIEPVGLHHDGDAAATRTGLGPRRPARGECAEPAGRHGHEDRGGRTSRACRDTVSS